MQSTRNEGWHDPTLVAQVCSQEMDEKRAIIEPNSVIGQVEERPPQKYTNRLEIMVAALQPL